MQRKIDAYALYFGLLREYVRGLHEKKLRFVEEAILVYVKKIKAGFIFCPLELAITIGVKKRK